MIIRIRKLAFIGGIILLLLMLPEKMFAASPDKISVFHSDGMAFSAKPLIFETNILPGDKFRRRFYVIKKDKFDQVLLMSFRKKLTPRENELARRIFVRLKRVSDGNFLRFPNGQKTISLARLYNYRDFKYSDAFRFDEIYGPAGARFDYELIFELSPQTGNRFQNRKTQFDLSVGIFSKSTGVCRDCLCFWRDFCCHPSNWACRWAGGLWGIR